MKVIVFTAASLALLPVTRSAADETRILFLSLEEKPTQWISDKPANLLVDSLMEPSDIQ